LDQRLDGTNENRNNGFFIVADVIVLARLNTRNPKVPQNKTPIILKAIRVRGEAVLSRLYDISFSESLHFVEISDPELRHSFDSALDLTHYAKSCQRVGRCMRLAIMHGHRWVGGIVLGSTFPNVGVRDDALGLKIFVAGYASRGLKNPWSGKNCEYWDCLQTIVNHARTFVFPEFQGRGLGKEAHKALLRTGVKSWERKYKQQVYALDTLCDHSDSGLFLSNGWTHVGQTKGYTSNYRRPFSLRKKSTPSINNASLKPGNTKWQVWVRVLRPELKPG
jgi:GNAT superfamily N-acetyltransferase